MSGTTTNATPVRIRRIGALKRSRVPTVGRALIFLVLGLVGLPRLKAATDSAPLRFGFSSQVFGDVNENDARAALKVWAESMSGARGVLLEPTPQILNGSEAIDDALLSKTIDMLTMTAEEFWSARRVVALGPIFLGRTRGITTEKYVLLVHRDNPFVRLADFRGRTISIQQGSRAALAKTWMETLLLEKSLGTADTFWGRTVTAGNLSRIVLPVFFRQIDACVVTLEGFRTMSELNPQVGERLRILAQSEALVPTVFCFRADLVSQNRDKLIAGIGQIADTPAGRQTLALFQSDDIEVGPISEMDSACALLDRHQRLLAEIGNPRAIETTVAPATISETGSR
jgi:ABC-type phosphate/phosphonate transport system substrate-binding protein